MLVLVLSSVMLASAVVLVVNLVLYPAVEVVLVDVVVVVLASLLCSCSCF